MVRKIRFYYLLLSALLRKQWKRVLFFAVILSTFVFLTFYLFPFFYKNIYHSGKGFFKQTYIEAIVSNPKTFNPLFSNLESEKEINSLVFRGLTKALPTGEIIGDLAEKIEVKNASEYIFYLKKNILWHDGKKFSADDVVYTVNLSQNSLYNSVVASNFKDVEIEKIDSYTVKFKLKEAFAPFLAATTVGIIPKHIELTDYRPIGTGKFRFVEVKKDSVTLESTNIKIQFKYYPSLAVAEVALKLGEVHAISGFELHNSDFSSWKNFTIYQANLPYRVTTLFFNTREETLKEKIVRQALAYAFSKEDLINDAGHVRGKVANNPFAGVDSFGINGKEKYSLNLDKAKQLLSAAGWQKRDNFLYKDGKKFSLLITTLSDSEFLEIAKKIKIAWEALGLEVEINVVSGSELKEHIVPNKIFTVLLTSQLLNYDPDQYVLWHTTQVKDANITGIASPKLDKLLEDGRTALEKKVRKEKYTEFSRFIADEVPAIFLYYPNYVWICSKRVKNIDLKDFREPQDRFRNSDAWKIESPLY